jgi:hypothetical protein
MTRVEIFLRISGLIRLSGYRARVSLDDDRSRPSTISQSHDAPPSVYPDEGESEFESDNDRSRPSTIAQSHDVPSWVYLDEGESDVDSDDDHSSLSTISQSHDAPSWVYLDEGESGVESDDDRSTTAQSHYAPSLNEGKSEVDSDDEQPSVESDEGSTKTDQPPTVTATSANRAHPCTWVSATGDACFFVLQPPVPPDEVGWLKVVRDHLKAVHSDDLAVRPGVKGIICRWRDDGHGHGPKIKKQNGQVVCRDVQSIVRHIVHPHLQMTFMCPLCGEEIRRKDRHIKKCNSRAARDPVGDAVGL